MKNLILTLSLLCISMGYIKAQSPSIAFYESHIICPTYSSPQLGISDLTFDSPNGDTLYMVDASLVNEGVGLEVYTGTYANQETSIHLIHYQGGQTGEYDVIVHFTYDGGPIYYDTIQVMVTDTLDMNVSSIELCGGIDEYNLYDHVVTKGGVFEINPFSGYGGYTGYPIEIEDGLLNVKEFLELYSAFPPFIYYYSYEDNHGCFHVFNESASISFTPTPEIDIINVTKAECNENLGEIELSVTSPYGSSSSYWSNGVQNSSIISGLSSGEYQFTVEDSLGCTNNLSVLVETDGLDIIGTVSDVKCKGGSDGKISIDLSGVSNNHKIIWSSGHSSKSVSGLLAGTYSVHVKDLDTGCEAYNIFEVNEPENALKINFTLSNPTRCDTTDGEININSLDFGTSPYQYLWNTGASTANINDLGIGYYSVLVTDSNGCKASFNRNLNPNSIPNLFMDFKQPTCGEENGAISIEGFSSNVITPVGYLWSNGDTTRNISAIGDGQYTVNITFDDGCISSNTYHLENYKFNYSPEICIVTVDTSTNTNLVVWEKEAGNPNDIDYYNIYRGNSTTGKYQPISTVDYTSISVFNDVVASPEVRSWKYKISAVNSCGQESYFSKRHKTIHLVMTDGPVAEEKKLTWDHYEGLEYFYYDLYRGTNVDGWQLIQGNISLSTLPDFTDVLPAGATEVDYIVEVIPTGGGCTATYNKVQDYNSSRSNKPSPIFNPGFGTGDPHNSVATYENDEFKALVYPNPSNGDFNIRIQNNINNESLNMTMLGVNGNIIHQKSLNNDLNTFQLNLDAGLYFIQIQGKSTLETIRVVIQ